ncbi:MAG: tetratricopeptide repeat protein [Bryobacteraceae bacterium]
MILRSLAVFCLLAACAPAQSLQRAEALWKARNYREANNAFRALVAANPKNPEYRVRWGRLFLERFNAEEAAKLFQEALEIKKDDAAALLGLALVAAEDFEGKAEKLAEAAAEADPKLFEARELMARLALEDNNPKKASEQAEMALAISPKALEAMSILATVDWLEDKKQTPWIDKILQQNPHYGQAYETAGHFFFINRRYEEAIQFYRKAIDLTPDLWSAHSQLGLNLMRQGIEGEARKELELSYANDYRDAATVNTLRLMDSYKNFVTFKTDRTILRLHKKEADVLRPYFEAEMERAIATYEKKYQMKLDRPVQVEVYPDHEDFAVRTMGMPGLGALGVTFGYVVAMDSPSGRPPGTFHWASTMWHEMSHVYVLTATKHRVPRWFTEGMAVHEETAISKDWGDRLDTQAIMAIKDKKLLPVADLDRGFVHPQYPSQVIVSYFQAGRICDYIARKWGDQKLLDMIHGFAGNETTAEVIEKQLGMKPEAFDKEFLASLEAETKKTVEGFDTWKKQLKPIAEASKAGRNDEVIEKAKAIRDLYPDYVEAANVYEFLSTAYLAKGDKAAATSELERYSRVGGRNPATLKKLASLLEESGRKKEAAAVLDRLNYIAPVDEELHRKLGDLWLALNNDDGAIREYRAALAMKPLDQAGNHFNLAKAYHAAKKDDQAREEVMTSLEAAPNYKPAQKLLLELTAETAK